MKRRQLLKVLPALCLPPAIQAQLGSRQEPSERTKREAEEQDHRDSSVPIYPLEERVVVNAPFSATFLATIPSLGHEYQICLWRRSGGSTRSETVFPWLPVPVEIRLTDIVNHALLKKFGFVTVDGVLKDPPGVTEEPIPPKAVSITEDRNHVVRTFEDGRIEATSKSLVERAWKTLESENSVVLQGVDNRPCKRLLLESPYGSKTLEVWLSEDLGTILKEELRRNGETQHFYVATRIERSEPHPSLFEPPFSGSALPSQTP